MQSIIFHNSNSGWGNHSKSGIKAALKLAGFETTFCDADDKVLAQPDLGQKIDLIVVAGGDGTVAKIVSQLVDRTVPVAILPLGTANNIARSVGVFGNPVDLAECWDLEHWRPLNIGAIKGSFGKTQFVESFGIGIFPKLIKKGAAFTSQGAEALSDGRKLLSKLVAKADPIKFKPSDIEVALDADLLAVEVTSIAYIGPGLPLAPNAKAGDGVLEVITLAAHQREDFIKWLANSCEGPAPVTVQRCVRASLSWEKQPYRIDDESFDATKEMMTVGIELSPNPVRVLVRPALPHVASVSYRALDVKHAG